MYVRLPRKEDQAFSQEEAMMHGLQHKFGNLTLFSPQTCSDDINWAGPQHLLQDHMSAIAEADQGHCFALISQTSQLSLDERWAHMKSWEMLGLSWHFRDSIGRLNLRKVPDYVPGEEMRNKKWQTNAIYETTGARTNNWNNGAALEWSVAKMCGVCLGMGGVGGKLIYTHEISPLIPMQLQITNKCSVRLGLLHFISETSQWNSHTTEIWNIKVLWYVSDTYCVSVNASLVQHQNKTSSKLTLNPIHISTFKLFYCYYHLSEDARLYKWRLEFCTVIPRF